MKQSILISIFLLVLISYSFAVERLVVRIDQPSPEAFQQYLAQNVDIASYHPGVYLDLVIPASDLALYQAQHPGLQITQTEAQLKANLSSKDRDIPGYSNYAAMMTEIQSLQAQYPHLISTEIIGSGWGSVYAQTIPYYSSYNHQIAAIKVSNNVMIDEDEPAIYFCGGHHAREPMGVEVTLEILTYLAENYNLDPFVTNLLNTTQIWIVPLLNPDGHKIVLDQTDVWWRKNIRDNNNSHSFDFDNSGYGDDGIDINRNYGWEWGYVSATDDMNSVTYHGIAPFSEPETTAFRDLLRSKPFIAGISYHTYGQYVLYPYGYQSNLYAPDLAELRSLAQSVAGATGGQQGGFYTPMPSWQLYPVSGSLDDWAYGELGIFAYTVEMATEFIPNASYIPQIVQNNLGGALQFLQRRNRAMLYGHVTDINTGQPVEAVIHVRGLDDHPLPRGDYKSNLQFGSYYRLLSPGSYTVDYFAPGFAAQSSIVQISDTDISLQDIQLSPIDHTAVRLRVIQDANPEIPIQGASLRFPDLQLETFSSDASGHFYIPSFAPGTYRIELSKENYDTLYGWQDISWGATFSLQQAATFYDGFESGVANWLRTGSWNISSQSFAGTASLSDSPTGNYQNNTESLCKLIAPINLSATTGVCLQFRAKYSIALDGDYAALEYSRDNLVWQALDYYNGVQDWTLLSYNLSGLNTGDIHLRFRMFCNSSGRADGIYIDEFKLYNSYYEPTETIDPQLVPMAVKLSAYPNPFSNKLNLLVESKQPQNTAFQLEIYNLRGQKVYTDVINLTNTAQYYSWNGIDDSGKALGSGIYFVKLIDRKAVLSSARIMLIK